MQAAHSQLRKTISSSLLAMLLAGILLAAGCKHDIAANAEIYYVIAPQAFLRDRVATVYNRVGTVKNGDRVEALDHLKRFVKVRTAKGEEGWIEQRFLVPQQVFTQFETLYRETAPRTVQAKAVLRNDFRLHVSPGKDTDKLFLLPEGTKVELVERQSVPKAGVGALPKAEKPEEKKDEADKGSDAVEEKENAEPAKPANTGSKTAPLSSGAKVESPKRPVAKPSPHKAVADAEVPMEDWWLIRDQQKHAGWVPGRQLDVDIPLEIAQYAEGQRIIADFVLTEVDDPAVDRPDKKVPVYLVLMTPPRDGMPFDYDQVRVFTWNVKRHRYETAYRDRNLYGVLPVTVGKQDFGKDGVLPVFTLRAKDDSGAVQELKYRLMYPIVRRVLAPGEEASRSVHMRGAEKKRGH